MTWLLIDRRNSTGMSSNTGRKSLGTSWGQVLGVYDNKEDAEEDGEELLNTNIGIVEIEIWESKLVKTGKCIVPIGWEDAGD